MKKVVIIYDDTVEVSPRIKTIIGKNSYGDIVIKRKNLFNKFKEILETSKIDYKLIRIRDLDEIDDKLINSLDNKIVLHYFSNCPVNDTSNFDLFINKLIYAKENFMVYNGSLVGLIFKDKNSYIHFLENYKYDKKIESYISFEKMQIKNCLDISNYQNLLYYISGGFDARYFNSISGDEYTVVKASNDKKKMKMEYTYYHLLPDEMKKWMVMPYNFIEEENRASYTMERMPMTDIAIRWTHGAVNLEEFKMILDKSFRFIKERPLKEVSSSKYLEIANKLYLEKLDNRIEDLKKCKEYKKISLLIESGTDFKNIDEIIDLYKEIYNKEIKKDKDNVLAISHGDLFFANMLYSKEVNMLKLIDPKGALEEKDLWIHPYYDIAKLSHSICGKYDFFNVDGFSIYLNKDMKFELYINKTNNKYVEIFKEYLKENNYDYNLVRTYEASLFLSMLPLHIDNPQKVFGFILNAINILKELKDNV